MPKSRKWTIEPDYGPANALPYPNLGAKVAKYRKLPRGDHRYADAIHEAVKALQMRELLGEGTAMRMPNSASGTFHNDGAAIHKAMRAKQHAALIACPDAIRAKRKDVDLILQYEAAMAEKRKREMPLAA